MSALKQRLRQLENSKKTQPGKTAKRPRESYTPILTVEEIKSAEKEILKAVQEMASHEDISTRKSLQTKVEGEERSAARQKETAMRKTSSIHCLDPFLDKDDVLRVGGRIKRGSFMEEIKFPVIIPRKGHVTDLIIKYFHEKVQHQGRGMSLNEIRSNGFWVIGGTSAVAYVISKCVTCRNLRGAAQEQKMSDFPEDRLESSPPPPLHLLCR